MGGGGRGGGGGGYTCWRAMLMAGAVQYSCLFGECEARAGRGDKGVRKRAKFRGREKKKRKSRYIYNERQVVEGKREENKRKLILEYKTPLGNC